MGGFWQIFVMFGCTGAWCRCVSITSPCWATTPDPAVNARHYGAGRGGARRLLCERDAQKKVVAGSAALTGLLVSPNQRYMASTCRVSTPSFRLHKWGIGGHHHWLRANESYSFGLPSIFTFMQTIPSTGIISPSGPALLVVSLPSVAHLLYVDASFHHQ